MFKMGGLERGALLRLE